MAITATEVEAVVMASTVMVVVVVLVAALPMVPVRSGREIDIDSLTYIGNGGLSLSGISTAMYDRDEEDEVDCGISSTNHTDESSGSDDDSNHDDTVSVASTLN